MTPQSPEQRIKNLQFALKVLSECQYESPEMDFSEAIEQADHKLHQLYHEYGWHCVTNTDYPAAIMFQGTFDKCTLYVDIWTEANPEDKDKITITPY